MILPNAFHAGTRRICCPARARFTAHARAFLKGVPAVCVNLGIRMVPCLLAYLLARGVIETAARLQLPPHTPPLHSTPPEWVSGDISRPVRVYAQASNGIADAELGRACEDTISVNAVWESTAPSTAGALRKPTTIATYTASWAAPPSDVHSQQRFHALAQRGEVTVDQAHRGFSTATDAGGFASPNPLFMKYTPSEGRFVGQQGYGYRSIEAFIAAAAAINAGAATARSFDAQLPTVHATFLTTVVLEAGRRSLDAGGAVMEILYAEQGETSHARPVEIRPVVGVKGG